MISKTTAGIAAAIGGTMFLSYCVYFDRKRRSDPLFKKKLKERREKANQNKETDTSNIQIPNMNDSEACQQFFFNEVQLGEFLLTRGKVDEAVEHIAHAVAICGQPAQLLGVLQQTIPPEVFSMLNKRIPAVSAKIARLALQQKKDGPTAKIIEDELE
ncbi:Mitochondrial import receptor subunit TOM20 B [Nymphon striatum]|nr:Mitochondrial import receptor subunit TOM20 B [Nymphon striatum]